MGARTMLAMFLHWPPPQPSPSWGGREATVCAVIENYEQNRLCGRKYGGNVLFIL